MMASSSSSSSKLRKNYHVFLSFRGTDVRNNFLGHLYDALDSKGIHAYKDDEKLRKGEEITPALMEAIEGSHLAVIVLSENYAESAFCLRELTRVMECKKLGQIVVLPVFFKVEPREVRGQRESYGRVMARHEEKLGVGSEELAKWRDALRAVGVLSGWHIQDTDEADLVRSIVKEVLSQLDRPPLHVAKYPVGLDPRVAIVTSKLERQSKEVSIVGIWGTGGVGKTTIAKALYNSLSNGFVDRCFIANVREHSSNSGGIIKLQQQFLSEVLREKDFPVFSVDEGIELIKDRLCCKKILLVLDDVDKLEQLDSLAGRCDWFGRGSRIIITTRDRHLLTCHGIDQDEIFTAEELRHDEALELFCSHAFRTNEIKGIDEVIVDRVLGYASRLPLALVVLGSFLCGRSEPVWRSAIKRLEKKPDKTINTLLKISFDGLEENEKEIFLDIACFLKGKRVEYVMQVLDSCGFDTILGLELLKERCLIQFTSQMHDLLQLMAMDIVRQENPDNPGMRSRLWLYDDVAEVLSGNLGTNAITGIVLMLPEPRELYISPDAFRNMRRLRLLILHNVNLCGGPVYLPDNVRWLELRNCSIPDLGFDPGSKKLVMLDMRNSRITRLESRFASFKYFKTAKFANCESLVQIPDLSAAPNLQTLDLSNCQQLIEVDQSVGRLVKLVNLKLRGCSGLTIFPDKLMSDALQTLDFTDCSKLKKFPEIIVRMQRLYEVHMERSGIEELPTSIENLIAVQSFNLKDCANLASVPSSIYKLQTLESLVLKGCSRLKKFPGATEDLTDPEISYGCPKLRHLDLRDCESLVQIPDLSAAPNLQTLDLSNCPRLIEVDQSVGRLVKLVNLKLRGCSGLTIFPDKLMSKALQTLDFTDCSKLKKFPEIIVRMRWLYEVHMQGSGIEELPTSIENLIAVETFNLEDCANLACVPSSIYKLQTLESLVLKGCSRLKKFPGATEDLTDRKISYGCPKLRHLDLSGCGLRDAEFLENAKCFPGVRSLKLSGNEISALRLHDRRNFDYSSFEGCQKMRKISISGCCKFTEDFINRPDPPKVVHGNAEVDVVFSDKTIPQWLKQHEFSCQNRGEEYSSSFWLTRQQLIHTSTLALGFVISLKDSTLLDVDVSGQIRAEVHGNGAYSYWKEFPALKSDIMWLQMFTIRKTVDDSVIWPRQSEPIHVSVSLRLSTSCVELKEFGYGILRNRHNYGSTFCIRYEEEANNHVEDGNNSIEPDSWSSEEYSIDSDSEFMYEEGPGESSRANYWEDADCSDEDIGADPKEMRQDLRNNGYDFEGGQPENSTSGTEQNRSGTAPTSDLSSSNARERVGLQWLLDEW